MISPEIIRTLRRASVSASIPTPLAIAICQVESAGDQYAVRFEPQWKYFYRVEHFAQLCRITRDTEYALQAMSFGLMQVMGSVAREMGHTGNLIQLCEPAIGAKYGCMKLADLIRKYNSISDAVAAYNAGSPRRTQDGKYVNQQYVDKVIAYLRAPPAEGLS